MNSGGHPAGTAGVAGLILAGGRSRRFGREKAVARLDGEMLIARVLRVLEHGCAHIAVSAPPGSGAAGFAAAQGLAALPDAEGDADGPLAGVLSGLRWATAEGCDWLATAPCDTPLLPLDTVARLLAGRSEGGAVAHTAQGLHPLCALWPTTALYALERIDGHPPIRTLQQQIGAVRVAFEEADAFVNLNTVEDLRSAEKRPDPDYEP